MANHIASNHNTRQFTDPSPIQFIIHKLHSGIAWTMLLPAAGFAIVLFEIPYSHQV